MSIMPSIKRTKYRNRKRWKKDKREMRYEIKFEMLIFNEFMTHQITI